MAAMPASPSELILRRLTEGAASSAELEQSLGQSQSTTSRLLRQLIAGGQVIRIGSRRGARYALLRAIEGIGAQWPLRRIDEQGQVHELGTLHALSGGEYLMDTALEGFAWGGLTQGLPTTCRINVPRASSGARCRRAIPSSRFHSA